MLRTTTTCRGYFKIPESSEYPSNFVSRVKIPVLMLNGRYDAIEPLETAQLPMLQLLGTPEGQKRHVVYDSGHGLPRNESIKEILNWLDEHLGPIE